MASTGITGLDDEERADRAPRRARPFGKVAGLCSNQAKHHSHSAQIGVGPKRLRGADSSHRRI